MKHPQYVNFKCSLAIIVQPAALGVCLSCLFTLLYFPVKQNVSPRFHFMELLKTVDNKNGQFWS